MNKKKIGLIGFIGFLFGIVISSVLSFLGIPTYSDVLNYIFGESSEAGIWSGTILPLLFTLTIVALIVWGLVVYLKITSKETQS